ncbi:UDP-N-acetylmuramoyl-tripeptide--D-alanyl-D-alanine ligase, partial [Novacetimonas hansenii]
TGIIPAGITGEDYFVLNAAGSGARLWRAGYDATCIVTVEVTRHDAQGSDLDIRLPGWHGQARINAPGRHMAANAMLALAAADACGADMTRAADGLATFRPGTGRGAITHVMHDSVALLDESYNASPASVRAALDLLGLVAAGRRVVVLGDMLE